VSLGPHGALIILTARLRAYTRAVQRSRGAGPLSRIGVQKQRRHRHVRSWPSNGVVSTMTPSEAVDWEKCAIVAP
jgi:hypothetical protein